MPAFDPTPALTGNDTATSIINPALDVGALACQFTENGGRIQVRDFMLPEVAERLYRCLHHEVPWSLAFIGENGPTTLSYESLQQLPQAERFSLFQRISERARNEYQFLYDSYMMVRAYLEQRDSHLLLHRLLEFLNSPPFLHTIHRITGHSQLVKADAQATRFLPGHFLKRHNDFGYRTETGDHRKQFAYVLGLTRHWEADWGGLLHFLSDDGAVSDTYLPRFNTLTLFKVPVMHCVSYVAPHAREPRYSITGWLYSN